MARQLRVEYPGAIYHVTCRMIGDGREDRSRLFVDDRDRERFVDRLGDRVEQYNIRLYLFACIRLRCTVARIEKRLLGLRDERFGPTGRDARRP